MNIALFASHLEDDYAKTVCKGAMMASKETDTNLFIIPGRYFDSNYEDKERTQYRYQYDTLFSYVNSNNIDVLIIMMETIGSNWSYEKKSELLNRFKDIPVINISPDIENYHCVKFDNKTGLRDGIEHIIKKHNRKKIGFVSGPLTNKDAVERLEVYKDTMKANNLCFDNSMITYGNFSEYSEEATEKLLDSCPDIDAIIFSNDKMAIGGYHIMEKRGIKIGIDVSVMGFDDMQSAVSLTPKLTTVRADAVEIGYRSVYEAINLIKFGETKNPVVDSRLILRGSCGCKRNNFNSSENEYINDFINVEPDSIASNITNFIFESYKSTMPVENCKAYVFEFFNILVEKTIKNNNITREVDSDMTSILNILLDLNISEYIPMEKILFAINMVSRYAICNDKKYNSPDNILKLNEFFVNIYNDIITKYSVENSLHTNDIEYLSWMTNSLTRDMLMSAGNDKSFTTISEKLSEINIPSSYIFTFSQPIKHKKGNEWIPPKKIYLKSYYNNSNVKTLDSDKQEIDTSDIFINKFLPQNRQCSMVLSALYSNEDQYGLWLCEVDYHHFYYIAPVTVQLCAAMKTMHLIEEQEIIQKQLKESLELIKKNNILLDTISKSDELTGIYNRRGFFEATQNVVCDRRNKGKRAIIVFADMDCLKIINDQFGHDEGDYAIIKSAHILKNSFRKTDVVGRIGGDEFAAFALVECKNCVEVVRRRIKRKSERVNNISGKPYYVSISVGICEFECGPNVDVKNFLDVADEQLYVEKKTKQKNIIKNNNPVA